MDLSTFIQERRPEWRKLEETLELVEGSGLAALDDDQAVEFGRLYRRAASDLNQAQTFVSGDATVQYLNDLVARCYLVIYGKSKIDVGAVLRHLFWGFPAVFRRNLGHFLLATALFLGGLLFGFLVAEFDPASRAFVLPDDMPTIQPGEGAERTFTAGELSAFSSFLFTHNITVTLVVFAMGMTLGVGTAWMLFLNGLMAGALGAVFWDAGAGLEFATGILPHGVLEIPACLIGGAAGFVLAQGVIRARPWPRVEELARAGKEALLRVSGCFPLLIVAGFLEAGVARAPDWYLGSGVKLAVAGVFAVVFAVYTLLLGWGKPARPIEARA
jgi:uncharacterized membrane protein SpoIIM required for sporulation